MFDLGHDISRKNIPTATRYDRRRPWHHHGFRSSSSRTASVSNTLVHGDSLTRWPRRISTITCAGHSMFRSVSGTPGRRILARRFLPPWRTTGWVSTSHSKSSWSVNRSPILISIGSMGAVSDSAACAARVLAGRGVDFTRFRFDHLICPRQHRWVLPVKVSNHFRLVIGENWEGFPP
jgi:hypothetical protein